MALEFNVAEWCKADEGGQHAQVTVSAPQQVFCWSRVPKGQPLEGQYQYGEALCLRQYVDPTPLIGTDLNEGYPEQYVRKDDPDDAVPVDVIVYGAITAGLQVEGVADIVTFRNNLNKLCLTPLQPRDPWVIDATLLDSTLYLQIVKEPQQQQQGPDADRFTYYGYKFESLCTAGEGALVDTTGEFAVMVHVRVGRHRVLMAAEIDAWEPPPEGVSPEDERYFGYVELKTYNTPLGDRAKERHYRDKYPRWWIQSYLAGVPTLVAGARDRAGKLLSVERHPVARLPAIAREAGAPFDAYRLLRFADSALTWMAGVASSRPGEHWRFEHVPARGCIEAHVVEGGDLPARVDAVYREAAEAAEAGQGQGQGQQEGEQGYGEGEEEEQEYVAGGYQVSGVGDVDGGGVEPGDGEEEEG